MDFINNLIIISKCLHKNSVIFENCQIPWFLTLELQLWISNLSLHFFNIEHIGLTILNIVYIRIELFLEIIIEQRLNPFPANPNLLSVAFFNHEYRHIWEHNMHFIDFIIMSEPHFLIRHEITVQRFITCIIYLWL